jgi:hypothetical protein
MKAIRCATSLAVLAVSLALASVLSAATYYVDFDGGNDAADGLSAAKALKHVPGDPGAAGAAAAIKLAAGDTVIFKGGVCYRGNVVAKWPGAKDKPIVYDGNTAGTFGQGRAILDGGELVTGWRRCANAAECGGNPNFAKIWTATIPADVKGQTALSVGLTQGDRLAYPAQYPNPVDPFYSDKLEQFLELKTGMTRDGITDPRLAELGGELLAGGFACVYVTENDLQFPTIASYDAAQGAIKFVKPTGKDPAGKFAIANSLSAKVFDRAGEYVFVDKPEADGRRRVFLWPWDDRDPGEGDGTSCVVRPLAVDLGSGNSYVTVQGFLIRHYQEVLSVRRADGVVIRDNEITRIRGTGFSNAINGSQVNDLLFADNYVHDMPMLRTIVCHTGERVVYRGNKVVRGGRSPLVFYNIKFGRVLGNTILDCRGMHSNGISIYVRCRDILVYGNRVDDSNAALTLQNAERMYVIGNVFSGRDVLIGLWGGDPLRDSMFLNNTLVSPARNVYCNNREVTGCVFKNNIFGGFDGFHLGEGNTFANNLYTRRLLKPGEGEIVAEDMAKVFADPAKGDYRLLPSGPAVDAGTSVDSLLPKETFPGQDFGVDFAGRPRVFGGKIDVGAHEVEYEPGDRAKTEAGAAGKGASATAGPKFKPLAGAEPIVLPALSFSGQGGGKVEPIDPASCASVDLVRGWNNEGHYLEYKVEAPTPGAYLVRLRYTCQFDVARAVSVNGEAVKGLESVTLKATGGWKHFKEVDLPASVTLRQGANTLRLTSLGGRGCNLDRITLVSPKDAAIHITAGAFTGQGGGQVEVIPSPLSGLFCQWDQPGHWLEWTVENAKAGRYEVRIRYATLDVAQRSVSINGEPVKGLESVLFDVTDDWRQCAEVSLPAAVELKGGRNVIRLTNTGDSMNLDQVRLIQIE